MEVVHENWKTCGISSQSIGNKWIYFSDNKKPTRQSFVCIWWKNSEIPQWQRNPSIFAQKRLPETLLVDTRRISKKRKGDFMKIGEHQGFRADKEGRLGYVFPTITSNNNYMLFIYLRQTKNRPQRLYLFRKTPRKLKDEYNTRCYWTSERFVKIFKVILWATWKS